MSARHLSFTALAAIAVACGGPSHGAGTPTRDTPRRALEAHAADAVGDTSAAIAAWLDALASAAARVDDPYSDAVASAAVDALVHRRVDALDDVLPRTALLDRALGAERGRAEAVLRAVAERTTHPRVAPRVHEALARLAEQDGDATRAATHRARTGCATAARVYAPLAASILGDVERASPLAARGAPLPASVARARGAATGLPARAEGCSLPLDAGTAEAGVRDVVVDAVVPASGELYVTFASTTPATLWADGRLLARRPYAAGGGLVPRSARVAATRGGTLRLVVRAGSERPGERVVLTAVGPDGAPAKLTTPEPGGRAEAAVTAATAFEPPAATRTEERLVLALAALGDDEPRRAERALEEASKREDAPLGVLLAYGRALRRVIDLPPVRARELARGAFERALSRDPAAWEARAEIAALAGERRSESERRFETLRSLEAGPLGPRPAMLHAYAAALAGDATLQDRVAHHLAELRSLGDAAVRFDAELRGAAVVGRDRVTKACADAPARDRSSFTCFDALRAAGDRPAAAAEAERLRGLLGASALLAATEAEDALAAGAPDEARRALARLGPGQRPLALEATLAGLADDAVVARLATSPGGLTSGLPLLLARGAGLSRELDAATPEPAAELARRLPAGADDATVVLRHRELWDLDDRGVLRFAIADVRRVGGAADVERNAEAPLPSPVGPSSWRHVRRRIVKKDGRLVEPDRTPGALQAHAELTQLEQGDVVESVVEGLALPDERERVGADTADLLPDRTSVVTASIELRLPRDPGLRVHAHERLRARPPAERDGRRVLVFDLTNERVRPLESGVPPGDRAVAVSFGTGTWADVAEELRESQRALVADDDELRAWATRVAAGRPKGRDVVDALVAASHALVPEASGAALADLGFGRAPGPQSVTARTLVATKQGSRTWLLHRALAALGVESSIHVAESEPWTTHDDRPPRPGRFVHPLLRVTGLGEPFWIDPDGLGPPLPAGQLSPELVGRVAMGPDGALATLTAPKDDPRSRSELDLRLRVDAAGNAAGQLTALLRGRDAVALAETFGRVVGGDRDRLLRAAVQGVLPRAICDGLELGWKEGSPEVTLRAEVRLPAFAHDDGGPERTWTVPGFEPVHDLYPRGAASTLVSALAGRGARESTLQVPAATPWHLRRRVELPAGAKVVRLPGPVDHRGQLVAASRRVEVEGGGVAIVEHFELTQPGGSVPAAAYGAFLAEARAVDEGFLAGVRVAAPEARGATP